MIRFSTCAAVLLGSGLAAAAAQSPLSSLSGSSPVPAPAARTAPAQNPILQKGMSGPGQQNLVAGGNDACGSASLILGTGPYVGDNTGATLDGPVASCTGVFDTDVWYQWIAPSSGATRITLCSATTNYDTTLAVYDGGCGSAELACNDDSAVPCGVNGLFSDLTFPAVEGSSYTIRIGGFNGGTGTYEMTILLPAQTGSDSCATPDPVAGPGPHAFDNGSASTGAEGQTEGACLFFATTGINNDVWFAWTAPESGATTIATCGGTTIDTKLAVYAGNGCPGAATLACSDDDCGGGLQSSVTFPATKGSTYTIQLGTFPGASGGSGTFTISGPQPPNACSYDDGSSENSVGLGGLGGGEQVYLQRFGAAGETSIVHSLSASYGIPGVPGQAPAVGSLVVLSLFDDPNDDGTPDDLVLLGTRSSVIHSVDADILAASSFSSPIVVSGVYFAAVSVTSGSGEYPMSFDGGTPSSGRSWFVAEPVGGLNYSDLPGASFFDDVANFGLDGVWMVRVDCEALLTEFCFPGAGGVPACPCGNPPSSGDRGCENHGAVSGGASLAGSGLSSLGSDSLTLSAAGENNTALTLFWTASTPLVAHPGVAHGAGIRCVSGLKRLYVGNASGGAITRPGMGDPSISVRTATVGAPISPGETRYYFTIYRDPAAAGPCGNPASTVNLSSAVGALWLP
jgi:hypothetical protein